MKIHHVSMIVADVKKALHFYCDILRLEQDHARPDMNFEGAWINIAGQQIHLLKCPNPDTTTGRPEHGGRDRHLALSCKNLDDVKARLDQESIFYTLSKSGRSVLFCRDPDGNAIEVIQS